METFSPRSPDASETLWFDLSQFAKWKITESLLSVNQQSRGSAMASKELYPQITLWFFSQSDPENHPFFVSQKSSNPDEWQGRTVNLPQGKTYIYINHHLPEPFISENHISIHC